VNIVSVSGVMTVNTITSYEIITQIRGGGGFLDYLNIHKLKYTCAWLSVFLGLSTLTSETLLRSWTSLVLCVLLCSVDAVGQSGPSPELAIWFPVLWLANAKPKHCLNRERTKICRWMASEKEIYVGVDVASQTTTIIRWIPPSLLIPRSLEPANNSN